MKHGQPTWVTDTRGQHGKENWKEYGTGTLLDRRCGFLGVDDRGLLAVDGNPLQDVTVLEKVRFVMKGGTIHKRGE